LSGYEAGGEDYIVKPFSALELEAKLQKLIDAAAARLNGLARDASSAAMTAMISMSEMGALLEVIKQLGAAASLRSWRMPWWVAWVWAARWCAVARRRGVDAQ
jgi:CheY-like chemotaxis protein